MLTAPGVAVRLGTNRTVVTELARIGVLKGEKIGQSWAFEENEVDRFCKINGIGQRQPKPEEKGKSDGTE